MSIRISNLCKRDRNKDSWNGPPGFQHDSGEGDISNLKEYAWEGNNGLYAWLKEQKELSLRNIVRIPQPENTDLPTLIDGNLALHKERSRQALELEPDTK
jgi:hypothetical protein